MKSSILIILCGLFFTFPGYAQSFTFSPLITEQLVLQRGKTNVLKGTGTPGEEVKVTFLDKDYFTVTGQDGKWLVQTDVLHPGGPYRLTAISGDQIIQVESVWVGDVWICSGQSNMEYTVASFPWAEQEKEASGALPVFFYTLPNTLELIPSGEIPVSRWREAKGEDLLRLSATAWFFAKYIQPEIDVPVGLIVSAWSGTGLEPWMDKETLKRFPQFEEVLGELDMFTKTKADVEAGFKQYRTDEWDENYYLRGKGIEEKWYLPETDFSDWTPIRNPGYWEDAGIGLDDYDGAVWYKTTFDLPDDFTGDSFHLFLSYIKDYNITWVNGQQIGETYGDKNWSDYYVPADYLKPTGNVLVVRIFNVEGKGGINYHPFWETPILAGEWVCKADYRIDPAAFPIPQIVNVNPFSYPALLYNGMIHPLTDLSVTGFIWYQGESNVGRGYEYRTLFPAMIEGWRNRFNQGELPFYFVQLANHLEPATEPAQSQWAELRESQQQALSVPGTGMAVTIDIGEAYDIHPANKQEVGRRLALQALAGTYGKPVEYESPQVESVRFEKDKAILQIKTCSALQRRVPEETVSGFEVAGPDSRFYRAEVEFAEGKQIVVSSPYVPDPVAVRYAWADNPGPLNLINEAGLPLAPFRSDSWKGITDDRTFSLHNFYF